MKKTYTIKDISGISGIEFYGSGSRKMGKAEGDLTYTVNGETRTVTGEFYVDKDGFLVEEVFPTGNEEDGVVEIRIPVDICKYIYNVITSTSVSQHFLHHLNPAYHDYVECFESESLDEARGVYEKEVAYLRKEARPADWDFAEQDPASAVTCALSRMIEGEPETWEDIERSDYFYIPE